MAAVDMLLFAENYLLKGEECIHSYGSYPFFVWSCFFVPRTLQHWWSCHVMNATAPYPLEISLSALGYVLQPSWISFFPPFGYLPLYCDIIRCWSLYWIGNSCYLNYWKWYGSWSDLHCGAIWRQDMPARQWFWVGVFLRLCGG